MELFNAQWGIRARGEVQPSILNWFNVTYDSYYESSSNVLFCSADNQTAITASGFSESSIQVWDVTYPVTAHRVTPLQIVETNGSYAASFNSHTSGVYYINTHSALLLATNVQAVSDRYHLQALTNQADYLVITREDFAPALAPLIALREGQGLNCRIINIADIFNGFSHGLSTPYAVRDFLGYSTDSWSQSPAYVLLAAQGSYDYKDYKGGHENIVPAKLVQNPYYPCVSDNWLGDKDENAMPEVAIGRLPVTTVADLSNIVEKIVLYETDTLATAWSNNIIMTADNPDSGGDFPSTSDNAATNIPSTKTVNKIYLSDMDITTARNRLMEELKDGAFLFNFFGHGGRKQLAGEKLFINTDIPGLTNQYAMSIMLGMTCFINNFANYEAVYIGERMVLQEKGAMIATWAPSGNSLNALAAHLDNRFLYHYFNETHSRLGDIINQSIADYIDKGLETFETDQFILLGDPGLVLKKP